MGQSLKLNPKNDTSYYNIGYVYYLQDQYELSINYYDSALMYNKDNIYYLIARGNSFLEFDNFNLALLDYRKVITIDAETDQGRLRGDHDTPQSVLPVSFPDEDDAVAHGAEVPGVEDAPPGRHRDE